MKRSRKKYERPRKPWDKVRIEKEKEILKNFGLRSKKEIWVTEALLRKYRRLARELAAEQNKEKEKVLIEKLIKLGILKEGSTLDDVLGLTIENFLERRFQTIVFRKGFAQSIKQARQLVVHGHILVSGRRINYPSYIVSKDEENLITSEIPIAVKVKKNDTTNKTT